MPVYKNITSGTISISGGTGGVKGTGGNGDQENGINGNNGAFIKIQI